MAALALLMAIAIFRLAAVVAAVGATATTVVQVAVGAAGEALTHPAFLVLQLLMPVAAVAVAKQVAVQAAVAALAMARLLAVITPRRTRAAAEAAHTQLAPALPAAAALAS
jgi:hypothetical protein